MKNTAKTQWLRILALIPSAAMVFMDQSILPVALPVIGKDFGANNTSLQWTVNSYLLAMSVFILIAGKISDIVGHRKAYLTGIIFFAFFSLLCGMSTNVEYLIGARALQGAGAAIMFPAQTSLVALSFPKESRGRATGIMVSIGSISLVLGPLIGGYFTEVLSWRWIFWINLPIALLGIILTLALLNPIQGNKGKIDFIGFFYFAIFSTCITLFFMQAHEWGWTSSKLITTGVLFLVFLVLLLRRERKLSHPFMELSFFKRPLFASLTASISIAQFVLMITVFRTIYMEAILNYSPFMTGVITAFTSIPVLFFSYVGGFIADKFNPRVPVTLGYILIIVSFLWLGIFSLPGTWSLCFSYVLFGIGIPLIFTPSYSVAMSAIPPPKLGVAFGMIATIRMLAGTIGLALIFLYTQLDQEFHSPIVGKREAVIRSFSSVHYVLTILMILVFFATVYLHKRKARHEPPDYPAQGWD